VPYQRTDLDSLALTEPECRAQVQWIGDVAEPVSSRRSGARAVGALLRVGGGEHGGIAGAAYRGVGALTRVAPTSWAAEGVYALVAANRHRLPGGTPTCRL
jgi:hypothetical protein